MATTLLTYSAQNGLRMAAALGEEWDLRNESGQRRNATEDEFKQWIKGECQRLTVKHERRAAEQAIVITPPDIT